MSSPEKHCKSFIFLVIILLLLTRGGYSQVGLDFEVPLPPDSELKGTKVFQLGGHAVNALLYSSKEEYSAIVQYYQSALEGLGFQRIMNERDRKTEGRLLRFRKDDLVISIALTPKFGSTEVVIAKYVQPEGAPEPEKWRPSWKDSLFALPKQDLPGEDVRFIPRPPESVRWLSRVTSSQAQLIYSTSLSVNEAREFYRSRMSQDGWVLQRETATAETINSYQRQTGKSFLRAENPLADGENLNSVIQDSYLLHFKGSSGSIRITVFPNFVDRKNGAVVEIKYAQEK